MMMQKHNIYLGTLNPRLPFDDAEAVNPSEPTERCAGRFREAINTAIRRCRRGDRYWIASEMSRLLGQDITKTMIDSWTSESLDRHIPLEFMPGFCRVTGSSGLLEVFAEILGFDVVPPEEQDIIAVARIDARIEELMAKRERLKPRLRRYMEQKEGRR